MKYTAARATALRELSTRAVDIVSRRRARARADLDSSAAARLGARLCARDLLSRVEEPTGRILGAHLVGPHAEEVINIFALAVRYKLTAQDLKVTMFSYPSASSDVGYML